MKKIYLFLVVILSLTILSFSYSSKNGESQIEKYSPPNSTGPGINGNGDRTGGPLSAGNCATCHSGGNFSPFINIFITNGMGNQVTEYIPGENYIIEYSVLNTTGSPAAFGVQSVFLSPSAGNPEAGTLTSIVTPGSQIVTSGGYNYYEHSTPSTIGIFQVNWTAPVAGFGDVNIYASGLAIDGTGSTSGDQSTTPYVYTFPEACTPTASTDTQTACAPFLWIDGNTYTSSNSTATATYVNAGGCDSIVTLDLTINPVNTAVTQTGITLTADETGATYQWLNCDGNTLVSGETNQAFTPTVNGDYAVIVSVNACLDTSTCFTIDNVGMIENDFGTALLISPNPTNGNFSVDLGNTYNEVQVSITDLSGKLIKSSTYNDSKELNLKLNEPSGVYLLIIQSEDKKAVIRLIKN